MSESESPPQSMDEKLRHQKSDGGKARATLTQLGKLLGGYRILEEDRHGPTLVSVEAMDSRTWWRRVSKDVFQLEVDVTEGGRNGVAVDSSG